MKFREQMPTEEMLTDVDSHKIVRCSWCERYFDKETKEYKLRPEKDCGDGICLECMDDMMGVLDEYVR